MRFNNIQLLRVAAAVGVVLYHLGTHAPEVAGVGRSWMVNPVVACSPVPLFFAVSGFVLAHAVRSATPGRFLFARFLRLYPGYWLAVVCTLALMRIGAFTDLHREMARFAGVNTFTLKPAELGTTLYVLGVEWSLVYEMFLSAALAGLSLFGSRRGVPVLAGVWLAVIAVKIAVWPGLYFDQFPRLSTIALSGYNVPFLLGVLAYQVKDRGHGLRWVVLVAAGGLLFAAAAEPMPAETAWVCFGVVGAAAVWLAVRFPQLPDRHPLVSLGDCTYGLFLTHVPLMLVVLYATARYGWSGRDEVQWAAGTAAIVGGLAFGRLEAAIHTRLRPLAKWNPTGVRALAAITRRSVRGTGGG